MQKILKKSLSIVLALALFIASAMGMGLMNVINPESAYAAGSAVVTANAPDKVVKNGAGFAVNFLMNNTSGNAVFALDFELIYDKDAFAYVEGSIDATLFAASLAMTVREGNIKIAPESLPSATVNKERYQFATVVFKAKNTANAGNYTFQIKDLSVGTLDSADGEIPSSAVNATVTVEEPSASADLTSVTVKSNGTDLETTLSGTNYIVTNAVPYGASVTITAVVSAKASLKIAETSATSGQAESVTLNVGENTIPIEITAENGIAKKTYNVKITRASGNASTEITGLAVKGSNGANMNVSASGDIYSVAEQVSYADRTSIKLNVTVAASSKLKIAGNTATSGADTALILTEGENRVQIIVTSETSVQKAYILVIYVQAPKTEYGLASLSVHSGNTQFELSPVFSSDVYTYVLRIPDNTESIILAATTNDDSAEVVSGTGEYNKDQIGAGNILTVTVRAQSGETRSYQLVVVHTSSVKEGLTSLTVNGSKIDLIEGVYTYDIAVGKDVSMAELDFKTLFNEEVELLGKTELVEGNNTVILKVQLKDGSYCYYTINISKEIENDNTLTYVMIGVAVFLLIALIIAIVLAKRSKKKDDNKPDGGTHVSVILPESSAKETVAAKAEEKELKKPEELEKIKSNSDVDLIQVKEEQAKLENELEAVHEKSETTKLDGDEVLLHVSAETLKHAYVSLTREQKSFFDNLKKYALAKPGASIMTAKYYETIKIGKLPILKLQIKRSVTVASFMLENEQLKEFRMCAARKDGAQIKVKASEIAVCNLESYNTAVGLVDLMVKQSVK